MDSNLNFVIESGVNGAFGGAYSFEKSDLCEEEDVVYIGILPRHWGHFLIDTVSRLWYVARNLGSDYKIAFCGWNWPENKITGNYLQFFELLGIEENRLLFVSTPMVAKKIIIPEPTLGYSIAKREYMEVINTVVNNTMKAAKEKRRIDKIYFTRTQFGKSKLNEVGEKEIEECFHNVGFEVMAPEKMSLKEQIFYINGCSHMAAMTGTIPHNIVFARPGTTLILLNRTCKVNPPQIRINQMIDIRFAYIDVYTKWTLKHPRNYGGKDAGPIRVEVNDNLKRYFADQGWAMGKLSRKKRVVLKAKNWLVFNLLKIYIMIKESRYIRPIYDKAKRVYFKSKSS